MAESINFSSINTEAPVSIPDFSEGTGRGSSYITWGPTNNFPKEIWTAIQSSPTASSIINGTITMLKGCDITLAESVHELGQLPHWPYLNSKGDTIYDFIDTLAFDYFSVGEFAIQITWNKLKKIQELYAVPMEFVRTSADRDVIYFSKKWGNWTSDKTMIKYLPFSREDFPEETYTQMFIWTNAGHRQTYGVSPQNACLMDIVSEGIAARYIKNSLASGLASRYIISLPNASNLSDDQKAKIEDGMRAKFCGVENSGQFMLYFQNGDAKLTAEKVDMDNSSDVYNAIRNSARTNIFIANHATPSLFGDPTAATGFSEQEYEESWAVYNRMTLNPLKNVLCDSFRKIFGVDCLTFADNTKVNSLINND